MEHDPNCEWHFEQYDFECTCGLSEAERRVSKIMSYDSPGYEACVKAETNRLRANYQSYKDWKASNQKTE